MAAYHLRGSHIRLIASYYAKNMIRGGMGITFTLIALLVGLSVGAAFISPVEEILKDRGEFGGRHRRDPFGGRPNQNDPFGGAVGPAREIQKAEVVDVVKRQIGLPVAEWATGGDTELANFLMFNRPALVSAILMVLLFCTPILICFGAFNQTSGDIQYKGLRFLLLRTERANIFLGRFIGTAVFTLIVMGLVLLILFLYLALKADFYPTGEVLLWLLQGYLALSLLALPYIALCAWISASMDGGGVSLVICLLITVFPPIFVAIARAIHPSLQYMGWVMPWAFKYDLLHPNVVYWLASSGAMLLFTTLFVVLGMRQFQTRDL